MVIGILCVTGVVGLWSVTSILVKIALRFIDPLTLAFLRIVQGLIFFVVLFAARRKSWRSLLRPDRWVLVGGLGLSVNYLCFVLALRFTGAGVGGLVVQIQFVVLAVLSALVLRERLGPAKITGILSVIAGVLLVFGHTGALGDALRSDYALGNAIMLAAGVGWGTYALANKALSRRRGNLEILIPFFAQALVVSAVLSAWQFEIITPLNPQAILVIVALGFGSTGVGFLLMSEALRRLSGALVGTTTASTPLFTLLLANPILGETLGPRTFASAGLIIAGVLTIALTERRANRVPSRSSPESPSPRVWSRGR
jgi:drug/metabolite transporter (DMT)-like permease